MLSLDRGIPTDWQEPVSPLTRTILSLPVTGLAGRIRDGSLRSVDVVRAFAGRIAQFNAIYNAIVLLDLERALARAREADEATARGVSWGPLHGVPVTVKDTFAISGLRTTAGDPSLAHHVPVDDAVAVALLRRAGAIVLGKTNAATLAMDMQTTNVLFGTTNNPVDVALTAGGSSGGCATAVALHLSPLSIGSDLAGSIRVPAAYTGTWGLRPTHGVVSGRGHIPPKPGEVDGIRTMAVVGPIANAVEDLELALSVLACRSPEDETVAPLLPRPTEPLSPVGLKFAYRDELGGVPVDNAVKAGLHRVVHVLRAAGATVVDAEPKDFSYERTWDTWGALVGMQGDYQRSNLARRFVRALAWKDVAAIPHQRRILDSISVEAYMKALTEQTSQTNALERFLDGYDAWIVPVSSLPPFPHHERSRTFGMFNIYDRPLKVNGQDVPYYNVTQSCCTLFSVTQGPVVSMPSGRTPDGLPIGLQLVGRRYEDWRLLAVARAIEPLLAGLH